MAVKHARGGYRPPIRVAAGQVLVCAAVLLGMAGCVSAKKELAREQAGLVQSWRTRVAAPAGDHPRFVTWADALQQLRTQNPKLLAADLEVLHADEALDQTRRSLIPLGNFQAGYNRALEGNALVGFDPFHFAATAFFDVPGLLNYRTRFEAATLAVVRARLMRELAWREQVVELYRVVMADAEIAREIGRIDRVRAATRELALSRRLAVATATGEERLRDQWRETQVRLGDLLGLPGAEVSIAANELPPLPYADAQSRPSPADLARLPLQLAAVELVALRARELGVKLRAWPELNVSVSSPTFYRRSAGADDYWSSQELVAGLNAFWTLDTRGRRKSELRIAAAERRVRHAVLEQEASRVAAKISDALTQLNDTDKRLAEIENAIGTAPTNARGSLTTTQRKLRRARNEWQLVLWFFDDARWPAVPTLAEPNQERVASS